MMTAACVIHELDDASLVPVPVPGELEYLRKYAVRGVSAHFSASPVLTQSEEALWELIGMSWHGKSGQAGIP